MVTTTKKLLCGGPFGDHFFITGVKKNEKLHTQKHWKKDRLHDNRS